jgi:hypothetical protein
MPRRHRDVVCPHDQDAGCIPITRDGFCRFELRAAAPVRGVRELQQPGSRDGGGGVAAAGVHHRDRGLAGGQPGTVPEPLLHSRLLHRRIPDRTRRLQVRPHTPE